MEKSPSTPTGQRVELRSHFFKNTVTLYTDIFKISHKPCCCISHLPLLGACGFTEEDKHIRDDFLFLVYCRKIAPTSCFVTRSNPADFPLNLHLEPQHAKRSEEAANLVGGGLFFFYSNYTNYSELIFFIVLKGGD